MGERSKSFRDALNGRFVSPEEAALRPTETVAETVKPVDLEAVAERMYAFDVDDAARWQDAPQSVRERYRGMAKLAHAEIKGG